MPSESPVPSVPQQPNIKQKFVALLKRFKVSDEVWPLLLRLMVSWGPQVPVLPLGVGVLAGPCLRPTAYPVCCRPCCDGPAMAPWLCLCPFRVAKEGGELLDRQAGRLHGAQESVGLRQGCAATGCGCQYQVWAWRLFTPSSSYSRRTPCLLGLRGWGKDHLRAVQGGGAGPPAP